MPDGYGHFGHVRVAVTSPAPSGTDPIGWSVPEGDPGSRQRRYDGDLVRELGVDVRNRAVTIVGARQRLTESNPTAVRAAGAMAVADAFGLADRLRLDVDSGWRVTIA